VFAMFERWSWLLVAPVSTAHGTVMTKELLSPEGEMGTRDVDDEAKWRQRPKARRRRREQLRLPRPRGRVP